MIMKSSKKFKDVKFKFSEAKTAFVDVAKKIEKNKIKPLKFIVKIFQSH